MKSIDVILPVFNEEEVIGVFHRALSSVLDSLAERYTFNIIYVLDRSNDNSFAILKDICRDDRRVTVVHLARRFGHQMSLVAGIDHSRGDAAIMMDCDLQHPPDVIPDLLARFEEGYDIVHAVRRYDARIGLLKRWSSVLFYRIQNALSPIEMQSGAADFRLISKRVSRLFQTSLREQSQFLRGLFQWVGFRSTTVTFVSPPRAAGLSKYHVMRLVAFSITGILSFSKVPLRLATLLGFSFSTLSILYGLWLIVRFFIAGHMPAGYTSLIVMILFMGGLQLTVLGILGEYLGSVFDEVKRRPLYVVDEILQGRDWLGT